MIGYNTRLLFSHTPNDELTASITTGAGTIVTSLTSNFRIPRYLAILLLQNWTMAQASSMTRIPGRAIVRRWRGWFPVTC